MAIGLGVPGGRPVALGLEQGGEALLGGWNRLVEGRGQRRDALELGQHPSLRVVRDVRALPGPRAEPEADGGDGG